MKDTNNAEIMLTAWGDWQKGGEGTGINIIWRCMKDGAGASHATVAALPHMSPIVEVVERFLLTMPAHVRYAVDHRYIYESPDDYASKKLKCTPDTYRARLDYAAGELEVYLVEN